MDFTAGLDGVTFRSRGKKLLGGLYRSVGPGPRPTAILLHGVPGVEKNLDLAYALQAAGWNCLYFHYRGSWGSEGAYTFAGQVADVRAATDWLGEHPAVDAERLALVGSSMGGYVTLAAGATDPRFRALVPICPLVDPARAPLPPETFAEFADMLQGVTGPALQAQWEALPPVPTMRAALAERQILLVTGDQDEIFPPAHYEPLLEAVPTIGWRRVAEADHVFSARRGPLVEAVVDWLVARLGR
jgi:hypothetical protein